MNKAVKIILIYLGASVILIGLGLFWLYVNSFQDLTLVAPAERTKYISLYHADANTGKKTARVANVTINQPNRLKKGTYIAEFVQSGYKKVSRTVTLGDQPGRVSFSYDRTEAELQAILEANRTQIRQAMSQRYPNIFELFSIAQEGVYDNGTWYGAVLRYNGDRHSLQRDSLRIVLRQQGGQWNIVAKPYPTISRAEYPSIPQSVLSAINVINAQTAEPSQPSYGTTE